MKFTLSKQVKDAINNNKPVLALESTIISSGMPFPQSRKNMFRSRRGSRNNSYYQRRNSYWLG